MALNEMPSWPQVKAAILIPGDGQKLSVAAEAELPEEAQQSVHVKLGGGLFKEPVGKKMG